MLIAPQPACWGRSQAAIYQDCAGRPAQACDCEYQWRTFRGPWHWVAPARAPHFSCLPKKSEQKKPPRHPGLRFAQTSLLTGTVLLPNHLRRMENAACGFSTERSLVDNAARLSPLRITFKHERTDSPVKRVSGSGAEGVESQGCDESWPEERAKRVKESEAPCRAQPVARPKESTASRSASASQTPYSHPAQAESL